MYGYIDPCPNLAVEHEIICHHMTVIKNDIAIRTAEHEDKPFSAKHELFLKGRLKAYDYWMADWDKRIKAIKPRSTFGGLGS